MALFTDGLGDGSVLRHEAVFYRDDEEYAAQVGGFVTTRLADGHQVLVIVPERQWTWLAEILPAGRAARVQVLDMVALGRNPSRIIPAIRAFLDQHTGSPVSVVSECMWPGRTAEAAIEATRHEALVNLAFAGEPLTFVCAYDAGGLPEHVLADAARTHPTTRRGGRARRSGQYTDPALLWRSSGPLDPVPVHARTMGFDDHNLHAVRDLVHEVALRAELAPEQVDELTLAVWEVATNSVRHGGGSGVLHAWGGPACVLCQVADRGVITDPLAGRCRPATVNADDHGWGLYLANQLTDLLQIRTGPQGTTVRLRVDL